MKPAKFRVTTTDEFGKEVVIAEGLVQSCRMSTRPLPRYQLGDMSVTEYIPQPMEFELKGLVYPAEKEPEGDKRPGRRGRRPAGTKTIARPMERVR